MNRRGFLKFLGMATVGSTVAYSFPSVIVPKNLELITHISDSKNYSFGFTGFTKREIYPELISDTWFNDTPLFARLRANTIQQDYEWVHQRIVGGMM